MSNVSKKVIQQWLMEFAEGNEQAYEALFYEFYNPLLLYGKTITRHQHIVEDQIQEVFIWLYNHPHRCRSIHNLESYLYLALKKNILSLLRKESNQQIRGQDYAKDQAQAAMCKEEQWVQTDSHEQESYWLAEQISQLPPRMREVVYLRYYQCLGFDEIAILMSVTPQVARNFAFRALKKMRHALPKLQRILSLVLTLFIAS